MSKNYDVDHEAEAAKAAIRAIVARINGEFDQSDLVEFGPLSTDTLADVLAIAQAAMS